VLLTLLVRFCRARADAAVARASSARFASAVIVADLHLALDWTSTMRRARLFAIAESEDQRAREWLALVDRLEALR